MLRHPADVQKYETFITLYSLWVTPTISNNSKNVRPNYLGQFSTKMFANKRVESLLLFFQSYLLRVESLPNQKFPTNPNPNPNHPQKNQPQSNPGCCPQPPTHPTPTTAVEGAVGFSCGSAHMASIKAKSTADAPAEADGICTSVGWCRWCFFRMRSLGKAETK